MMRFLTCASLSLVLWILALPAGATPVPQGAIRDTLALYVKAHPYAVVAIGIIDGGRAKTYCVRGSKATAPCDERARFQIGSITKVFTATILAQMVLKNQLKLADPIQPILPAGVAAPTYKGKPITLQSLANHTSALPSNPPNYQNGYTTKMLDDALSATKLDRAPGSRWDYSNFGFAVLGQILARKADLPYDELVKRRILDPLGMSDTTVPLSVASVRDFGPTFQYGGAPSQPESLGALGPAGSMESDLHDMMTFLKANLEAPQGVLGHELAFAQAQRTPVPEWNMSMGLAWQTVLAPKHRVQGDLGDLEPGTVEKGGNTNGYSSFIAFNHASNWGIVAWTNVNDDDFQQVVEHAVSPRTAQMPILWALVRREPSPLNGTYIIRKGIQLSLDIFKYKGDLYLWASNSTPVKLRPLSDNRYTFDLVHLILMFQKDARGRTIGLTVSQNGKTFEAKRVR